MPHPAPWLSQMAQTPCALLLLADRRTRAANTRSFDRCRPIQRRCAPAAPPASGRADSLPQRFHPPPRLLSERPRGTAMFRGLYARCVTLNGPFGNALQDPDRAEHVEYDVILP